MALRRPSTTRAAVALAVTFWNASVLASKNEPGSTAAGLSALIRRLGPRWFLVRDVHGTPNTTLLKPRWEEMSFCGGR